MFFNTSLLTLALGIVGVAAAPGTLLERQSTDPWICFTSSITRTLTAKGRRLLAMLSSMTLEMTAYADAPDPQRRYPTAGLFD
ncbi:hypothetical protein HJFPF1_00044 [Paramyrothecium foliicola]|nr:hypothetical protein HJFPF1_00044 [Paramyrothecium foliicola]